jgi:VanZ family protein
MLFVGMAMFTFTIRHITQYLPLGILIAALGYEHYRGDRNVVFLKMGGLIGLMAILYMSLKVFTS